MATLSPAQSYEVEVIRKIEAVQVAIDQAQADDSVSRYDLDANLMTNLATLEAAVSTFLVDPYAVA